MATETLISPRALDILRLITPEWTRINDPSMMTIPEMQSLVAYGLIGFTYMGHSLYVKLNPVASQFVPEYFN